MKDNNQICLTIGAIQDFTTFYLGTSKELHALA